MLEQRDLAYALDLFQFPWSHYHLLTYMLNLISTL